MAGSGVVVIWQAMPRTGMMRERSCGRMEDVYAFVQMRSLRARRVPRGVVTV